MSKLTEALRRTRERQQSNFLPLFKFPDGKCDIRILPAATKAGDDSEDWFLPVGFHYNVEEKRPVFCPFETNWAEDDCPICEMVSELRANGMNEEAQKVSVRRQFLVRAIVRGEEEKGPQVVRLPSTLFTAVGTIVADTEAFGNILHPVKGRDIRVTKTGQGLSTTYSAMPLPKPRKVLDKVQAIKDMLGELTPILDLVQVPSAEELTKLIQDRLGYVADDFGDAADDDDLLSDDMLDDETDFEVSDDDDDVGDDVPFDEDDTEEDTSTVSSDDDDEDDDSWMDDDDDDDIVDVTAMVKADRAKDADDDGLTDDLEEALKDDDAPVVEKKKRRGKARVKK
jgi:hypothetical protein